VPITTLEQFYKELSAGAPDGLGYLLPDGITREIGHFNVFRIEDIQANALLFATPRVPYHYVPLDEDQAGYFCIFTEEFLHHSKTGINIDELPIFKAGGYPVFQLSAEYTAELDALFGKMYKELSSDYVFKYDLLRNYVLELIHHGQKLQPATALYPAHNASARTASPSMSITSIRS
jgi:hypothetical protein